MEIYRTFIGSFLWEKYIGGKKIKWAVRNVLSDSDYFGSCCKELKMTQTHAIFMKMNLQSLVQRLFKKGDKREEKLSSLQAFVSRRSMIIQSHGNVSQWCCSLTHPSTAHFLRVIWSQGESRVKTHFDTIKYNLGAKRTANCIVTQTSECSLNFIKLLRQIFYFLVNTLNLLEEFNPLGEKGEEKVYGQIYVGVTEFLFKTSGPSDMAENPLYMKLAILRAKTNFSEKITGPG